MSILKMLLTTVSLGEGQQQWTTLNGPSTYSWVVPAGVTRICGVAIGGGANGNGGGLHWVNEILVFPGETLTIQVGSDLASNPLVESAIKRGSTYLVRATNVSFYPTLGGGGGDGGNGPSGGAGGYVGNGGSFPNGPPATNSGGGQARAGGSDGEGVGLQGRTPTFDPGSRGLPKCGGGNDGGGGVQGLPGGVRIMWGFNRSYPDAAVDI